MINETDTKKGNSMDLNRQLIEAMADLNEDLVIATVRQMAAEGHSFEEIQQCLNTGISAVVLAPWAPALSGGTISLPT